MLLTLPDVPTGYTTKGPTTSSSGPEFGAAVPVAVPIAYVAFNMDSNPIAPGGPTTTNDGIVEAVAQVGSTQEAADLLSHVLSVAQKCGDTGTPVTLPGSVPGLVASTSSSAARAEMIASAVVYSSKSSYVVSVRWFNENLAITSSATQPAAPQFPTPQVMGQVVDAALARIPR